MIFRSLFQWKSPAGSDARLSVLIFHRVLKEPDPLVPDEMDAQRFHAICGWLKTWFAVLPMDEAASRLISGTLPARAACITFDDGYEDNHSVALPILRSYGLTATFFIATGFLDGGYMWNDAIIETLRAASGSVLDLTQLGLGKYCVASIEDKRVAVSELLSQIKYMPTERRTAITEGMLRTVGIEMPCNLMLSSQQVVSLHQLGMQIGAHTISHPILAQLSDEQARREVEGSKCHLEQLVGARIGLFAYPNGRFGTDYTVDNVDTVRCLGFDAAVSTDIGSSTCGDDVFQIRRFTPWDRSRLQFGIRLLLNLHRR